jgi:ribonuclease P protein component
VTARVSQRMTKSMRLRRRPEFVTVQSSGRKIHGKLFMALVVEARGDAPVGRVGLTVTKRIGNAVTRNRIKRRAREWLRRHGWVPSGRDVVLVAKEGAAAASSADVGGDLARIVERIGGRGAGGGGAGVVRQASC